MDILKTCLCRGLGAFKKQWKEKKQDWKIGKIGWAIFYSHKLPFGEKAAHIDRTTDVDTKFEALKILAKANGAVGNEAKVWLVGAVISSNKDERNRICMNAFQACADVVERRWLRKR